MKKGKVRRLWPRVLLGIAVALILIVGIYVLYVVLTYERVEDKQTLTISAPTQAAEPIVTNKDYRMISYNIGFGAYTPDFTFFMDGGKESKAESEQSVIRTTDGAAKTAKETDPDFIMFEEVDLDSTRSHHVDQMEMLAKAFPDYYHHFAINYNSAFLMVPPWDPIGKSLSGVALYSKHPVSSALRRSLPIASGFNKFLDLDRCYTVSRLPVEGGKELCLYTVHLSAYGHDSSVREKQVGMLMEDMEKEYQAGNYVICGGDFNHDMRNTGPADEDTMSWAHPFPRKSLPKHFHVAMDQVPSAQKAAMPESTRNTDIPYDPAKSYMVTVDGFILSDNVRQLDFEVMDAQFQYSDHNPVLLKFVLQ